MHHSFNAARHAGPGGTACTPCKMRETESNTVRGHARYSVRCENVAQAIRRAGAGGAEKDKETERDVDIVFTLCSSESSRLRASEA